MNRVLRLLVPAAVVPVVLVGCVADDIDEGALSPPEIVRVAEGQSGASGTDAISAADTPAAELAAEEPAMEESMAVDGDDMASSYMPMWSIVTDFVVGDELPALPAESTGFVYRAGSSVPEATALALAAALGVDPQPQERPSEYMVDWAFGPDDGSAPSLSIDAYAQHYWWYSSGWNDRELADAMAEPACTESVDDEGNVTLDCPDWEPEPPVGVPTGTEAEARAREIIAAAGFDPDSLTFEVFADEWYASVYATEALIEGLEGLSGANWNFGFGAEGVLEYAGGQFATPEAVGPYPLVGIDAAVARLTEMYLDGSAWPMAVDAPAVDMAVEDTMVEDTMAVDEEITIAEPEPAPPTTVPPVESEIIEEFVPTEITVALVDVQADLWWTEDVDGNVWLLPAYRFIGDDGNWYTVPAVTDEYMVETPVYDEPVPMEVEPTVDDARSSGAAGSGFAPSPELLDMLAPLDLADVDSAVIAALEQIAMGDLAVSEQLFADTALEFGVEMRVVERDGEPLEVTEDYRTDRINVVVVDGNVVAIAGIG
jgi:hypothetical protein